VGWVPRVPAQEYSVKMTLRALAVRWGLLNKHEEHHERDEDPLWRVSRGAAPPANATQPW
jgi:hypothetical protein